MTRRINDFNRIDIQSQYIDHLIGSMDFMQIKDLLRDYVEYEKDKQTDSDLEAEILHEAPYLLEEEWQRLEVQNA